MGGNGEGRVCELRGSEAGAGEDVKRGREARGQAQGHREARGMHAPTVGTLDGSSAARHRGARGRLASTLG